MWSPGGTIEHSINESLRDSTLFSSSSEHSNKLLGYDRVVPCGTQGPMTCSATDKIIRLCAGSRLEWRVLDIFSRVEERKSMSRVVRFIILFALILNCAASFPSQERSADFKETVVNGSLAELRNKHRVWLI